MQAGFGTCSATEVAKKVGHPDDQLRRMDIERDYANWSRVFFHIGSPLCRKIRVTGVAVLQNADEVGDDGALVAGVGAQNAGNGFFAAGLF